MIWWKHSFERLNEEFELTEKKRQALDNLLNNGRISQSTYESFKKEMDEVIAEITRQQKVLLEKMNSKTEELEQQVKTLEMLLANFEIRHVSGEIDEEAYQRETNLLSAGLDALREELNVVKEAINRLSNSEQEPTTEIVEPQETESQPTESIEISTEPQIETKEETLAAVEPEGTTEVNVEKVLPEPPVEPEETSETSSFRDPQENWQETGETQETSQITEEEQSTETIVEEVQD